MMTVVRRASGVEERELNNLEGSHCTDFQIVFVCVMINVVVGEGMKMIYSGQAEARD